MSQAGGNSTTGGGGGGSGILTLSAEHGAPDLPAAGNFDFSGLNPGAITFSTAGAGQMNAAVNVDNVTIQINGANELAAIGGLVPVTLTPDTGGAISSVGANFNITGLGGLISRKNANPNLQFTNKRFTTAFVVDPSSTFGSQGEYTTISAAVAAAAAAGGGQVFVRSGTYVENVTIPPFVAITGYESFPSLFGTPIGAIIDGTVTMTGTGIASISNICIAPSGAGACINMTGVGSPSILFCTNVQLNSAVSAMVIGDNINAQAIFQGCNFISSGTDFVNTTGAQFQISNSFLLDAAGANPAIRSSAGGVRVEWCSGNCTFVGTGTGRIDTLHCNLSTNATASVTLSGTAGMNANYSSLDSTNVTAGIALTGTSNFTAVNSQLSTNGFGNPPAVSIGAGCQANLINTEIGTSSATFAVTGTGTLSYQFITFNQSNSSLDPGLTINVVSGKPLTTVSGAGSHPGLAYFESTEFTVDSTGKVSLATAPFAWTKINANQTLVKDNGYFVTGGPINLALPVTSAIGDEIRIAGDGGQWTITQGAGQQVLFSSLQSTVGVGGSVSSTTTGDAVHLVCETANTIWRIVDQPIGNITFV